MQTITMPVHVGIYNDCQAIARVYEDRTVATIPTVRWIGNTGGYHEGKHRIAGADHESIKAALADDCEDTAWKIIYGAIAA